MSATAEDLLASASEVLGPIRELSANRDTLSKLDEEDCSTTCRRLLAGRALEGRSACGLCALRPAWARMCCLCSCILSGCCSRAPGSLPV